jgi:hypothetical protein
VCCSFTEIENNFGISNNGIVYAVYAYQATRKDELSFECGERLTVVRRGDVTEKEWWWARGIRNQFGYIPRNLLGVGIYFKLFQLICLQGPPCAWASMLIKNEMDNLTCRIKTKTLLPRHFR